MNPAPDMTQSEKPHKEKHGNKNNAQIIVYYDGACPKCIRDRQNYEKLSGQSGEDVCWFDITGRDSQLHELGIDPKKALSKLHICDKNGCIVSELDAYILLMQKVSLLKPIAWFLGLPIIRPLLAKLYHQQVKKKRVTLKCCSS